MSRTVHEQKAALRSALAERLRSVSAAERAQAGAAIRERLLGLEIWRQARTVLLFTPMACEPDILPLFEDAAAAGKTAAAPGFDPAAGAYLPRRVLGLQGLRPGRFGILEPRPGAEEIPRNQLDLILVPGVAFDAAGHRLGRGKGYYDRMLDGAAGHACGIAFAWQTLPDIPCEPHDMAVHSLLTPLSWRRAA